jgi:hypothetical protein
MIFYRHTVESMVDYAYVLDHTDYVVKVKLYKGALSDRKIEFDVWFGRIPVTRESKEVAINWESIGLNHSNIFYTDSNSMKMI